MKPAIAITQKALPTYRILANDGCFLVCPRMEKWPFGGKREIFHKLFLHAGRTTI
jgi:hypothetical protein